MGEYWGDGWDRKLGAAMLGLDRSQAVWCSVGIFKWKRPYFGLGIWPTFNIRVDLHFIFSRDWQIWSHKFQLFWSKCCSIHSKIVLLINFEEAIITKRFYKGNSVQCTDLNRKLCKTMKIAKAFIFKTERKGVACGRASNKLWHFWYAAQWGGGQSGCATWCLNQNVSVFLYIYIYL